MKQGPKTRERHWHEREERKEGMKERSRKKHFPIGTDTTYTRVCTRANKHTYKSSLDSSGQDGHCIGFCILQYSFDNTKANVSKTKMTRAP